MNSTSKTLFKICIFNTVIFLKLKYYLHYLKLSLQVKDYIDELIIF